MKSSVEILLLRMGVIFAPSVKSKRRFIRSLDKRLRSQKPKNEKKKVNQDQESNSAIVSYEKQDRFQTDVRLIAFYLPQFHPFPENDEWWGKGFTEWTNATKALPLFDGHYQPHLPTHFGFYDLRVPQVLEEQSKIAAEYGIAGFAYYFYWFEGKTLMEAPLAAMLENKSVTMPFCLIWANESWSRRWTGEEKNVLIKQEHSLEDSAAFFEHVKTYFGDDRYIKINGMPLLVIYRSDLFDNCSEHLLLWRKLAKEAGYPGIYCVCAQVFGASDPRDCGFDAAMQFPPHGLRPDDISATVAGLPSDFSGRVFDYKQAARNSILVGRDEYKVFPGVMLSWDNTARRGSSATVFSNFNLDAYSKWLSSIVFRIAKDDRYTKDEKLVFVNAWNEWAEGAHLEPDRRLGFSYLDATRRVMRNFSTESRAFIAPQFPSTRHADVAIIIHIHFEESILDIVTALKGLLKTKFDVYATVTSAKVADLLHRELPEAFIEIVENRGRDVRPFIQILQKISNFNYKAVCKIHGKVSRHRPDGGEWRNELIYSLCDDDVATLILEDPEIGIVSLQKHLLAHTKENSQGNRYWVEKIAEILGVSPWNAPFPAGTMFWFKPAALHRLKSLGDECFGMEEGFLDGTGAHAVERLIGTVCFSEGYKIQGIQEKKRSPE